MMKIQGNQQSGKVIIHSKRTFIHICIYIYIYIKILLSFFSTVCFHLPHLGSSQQPGAQVSILSGWTLRYPPFPTSLLAYTFETCQVSPFEAANKTRQGKDRSNVVVAATAVGVAVAVRVVVVVVA